MLRIAMWSGPRNISTAMLRAWGNRDDTFVCDEPLYANYLLEHGLDHPGRDEILAYHDSDLRRVVHWLTEDTSFGRTVFYQKHMAHHLLPETDRSWVAKLTNVFLIRDPAEMLTSLIHILPQPGLPDTGLPQQRELFDLECERLGQAPAVIDSADVLRDPRAGLESLCRAVGAEFDEAMLHWPSGRRETDGIWAPHWYGAVEKSTGFAPYRPKNEPVPEFLADVLEECQEHYDHLAAHRLLF
ncbi:MAG: HAD family hydrolase [Acidobacteriota bacterium]|nr:HAD family hydrolase [Acidobacteriota bacterium]